MKMKCNKRRHEKKMWKFYFFFLKSLVVKEIVLYLHSQKRSKLFKTYNIKTSGCGVIGSHARLRIWCREAWGFESLHPHYAKIAQLVEHNLAKVGVAGSNPVFRSTPCPGGGTGRHAGLKILCPQGRTGSSPVWGTRPSVISYGGFFVLIESVL